MDGIADSFALLIALFMADHNHNQFMSDAGQTMSILERLTYAVFKKLIFFETFNIFRWPNPILVSIGLVNAARTVNVWIGRGSF